MRYTHGWNRNAQLQATVLSTAAAICTLRDVSEITNQWQVMPELCVMESSRMPLPGSWILLHTRAYLKLSSKIYIALNIP
jgi:hypothetical protein